jgi:plasmid stability protein
VANVTVRGLDDDVKARIQYIAKANGRSLEAEPRRIITRAAVDERTMFTKERVDVGTQIRAVFNGIGEGLTPPFHPPRTCIRL